MSAQTGRVQERRHEASRAEVTSWASGLRRWQAHAAMPSTSMTSRVPQGTYRPCCHLRHAATHLRPAAGVKGGAAKLRGHSLRPVKQLESPVVAVQTEDSGAGGSLCGQGKGGRAEGRAERVRVCGASGGRRHPTRGDRRQPRRPGRYCHRRGREFGVPRRAPELRRGSPERNAKWSKAWAGAVNDRSGTCGLRLLMPMTDGSSQCRAAPCSDMAGRAACLGCRCTAGGFDRLQG